MILNNRLEGIITELKNNIRIKKHSSSKFPIFVFICGENILDESNNVKDADLLRFEKNRRQFLIDRVESISGRNVIGIIAENLIETFKEHDSLTFEGILADVSDEIIIIVESPGTYCELGAFSFSQKLIDKLYILNKIEYEGKESFINRGPIKKIEKSKGTYIYLDYDVENWKSEKKLDEHFEALKNKKVNYNVPKNIVNGDVEIAQVEIKEFIYEILNIVSIFQPITKKEFIHIYKFLRGNFRIIDTQEKVKQIEVVFSMLVKLGVLEKKEEYYLSMVGTSCNNYMFDLTIPQTEQYRARVINIYSKSEKERIEVMSNGYIAEDVS